MHIYLGIQFLVQHLSIPFDFFYRFLELENLGLNIEI